MLVLHVLTSTNQIRHSSANVRQTTPVSLNFFVLSITRPDTNPPNNPLNIINEPHSPTDC